MRYLLVLQWPGSSETDFDDLIGMEDRLSTALGDDARVDGHDFGSGEMNIFIETDEPADTFADAQPALGGFPQWALVRAAYREATSDTYTVIWPHDLADFAVT